MDNISKVSSKILDNNMVQFFAIVVFMATFIQYYMDEFPSVVKVVVKNVFVKFFVFMLGGYYITGNAWMAVGGAIILVIPSVVNMFTSKEGFELIWPGPDTYPGCYKMTVADLLKKFDGDEAKLKNVMYEAGVPLNISLTDFYAPMIATYLYPLGYDFGSGCAAKQEKHVRFDMKPTTTVSSCPSSTPVSIKDNGVSPSPSVSKPMTTVVGGMMVPLH